MSCQTLQTHNDFLGGLEKKFFLKLIKVKIKEVVMIQRNNDGIFVEAISVSFTVCTRLVYLTLDHCVC